MNKNGFSLIEMSIVLIIISLIIAGLISGQALLRSSKVMSTISEIEEYQTAIASFQDKYLGLPGDLINASDYFTDCVNIGTTNDCNGDGDGSIETETDETKECTRAWQHLVSARLIKGNYDGVLNSPLIIGTNIPRAKLDSGAYWMCNDTGAGNFIYFGIQNSGVIRGAVISPPEAENIDKKIDDANSNTGSVTAIDGTNVSANDCVTLTTPNYNLSNDNLACVMLFTLN